MYQPVSSAAAMLSCRLSTADTLACRLALIASAGVPSAPEVYPRGDGTVYMCGGGSGIWKNVQTKELYSWQGKIENLFQNRLEEKSLKV